MGAVPGASRHTATKRGGHRSLAFRFRMVGWGWGPQNLPDLAGSRCRPREGHRCRYTHLTHSTGTVLSGSHPFHAVLQLSTPPLTPAELPPTGHRYSLTPEIWLGPLTVRRCESAHTIALLQALGANAVHVRSVNPFILNRLQFHGLVPLPLPLPLPCCGWLSCCAPWVPCVQTSPGGTLSDTELSQEE